MLSGFFESERPSVQVILPKHRAGSCRVRTSVVPGLGRMLSSRSVPGLGSSISGLAETKRSKAETDLEDGGTPGILLWYCI